GRDPAGRARLHFGQQLRRESALRERAPAPFPGARRQVAKDRTRSRVAHDDELPWLLVLRARRERRRVEHARDELVGERLRRERATRALAVNDGEEIRGGFVHARERSPMRANEFTYMIRSAGQVAHSLNASVSTPPMRSITNGVIDLKTRSAS